MKVTFIDKKTATFGDMCIGDTFTRGGDTVYMRVYEWGNHNAMPLNGGNSGMAVKFDLDDEVVPCEAKLTVERGVNGWRVILYYVNFGSAQPPQYTTQKQAN